MWFSAFVACQFLTEVREQPSEVRYGGWVYDGYLTGVDDEVLADGTVDFFDPSADPDEDWEALEEDGLMWPGEQPYEGSPGYWRAVVPPEADVVVRLAAEDSYDSVWRGRSAEWDSIWLGGALFTWDREYTGAFLASLAEQLGVDLQDLDDGGVVHLWGRTWSEEHADRAWARRASPSPTGWGPRPAWSPSSRTMRACSTRAWGRRSTTSSP